MRVISASAANRKSRSRAISDEVQVSKNEFFCTSAVAEGDADGETTRLLNSRMTGAGGVSTSRSAAVSGRGLTLCVEYLLVSEMNMDNHVKGFFQHGSVRKESCRHGGLPGGDGTYPTRLCVSDVTLLSRHGGLSGVVPSTSNRVSTPESAILWEH